MEIYRLTGRSGKHIRLHDADDIAHADLIAHFIRRQKHILRRHIIVHPLRMIYAHGVLPFKLNKVVLVQPIYFTMDFPHSQGL